MNELVLAQSLFDAIKNRRKKRDDIIVLYSRLWDLPKPLTQQEALQLSATFDSINKAIVKRWSETSLTYIQKKVMNGRATTGGSSGKTGSSSGGGSQGASDGEIPVPDFVTLCTMLGLEDCILD